MPLKMLTLAALLAATPLYAQDQIALIVGKHALSQAALADYFAHSAPPPKGMPLSLWRQQNLTHLIDETLLEEEAQAQNITATDEDLTRALALLAQRAHTTPAEYLKRATAALKLSPEKFRAQLKAQIVREKARAALLATAPQLTPEQLRMEAAQVLRVSGLKLHLRDLFWPLPTGSAEARGAAASALRQKASALLKQHPGNLEALSQALPQTQVRDLGTVALAQLPLRFAQAVALLPVGETTPDFILDAQGLHLLQVLPVSHPQTPLPQVQVAQILLKVDNPGEAPLKKKAIEALYRQLQAGADFATLAAHYSQDPASATQGGLVGWMSPQEVVPAFAKVMMATPVGALSAPFQSRYGYHIIRVLGRRTIDGHNQDLRQRALQTVASHADEQALNQALKALRARTYIEIRGAQP